MNNIDILNEFGKEIVNNTRDRTLGYYLSLKKNQMKSKSDIILSSKLNELSPEQIEFLDELLTEITDMMLFNTLNFFEERCDIIFENENISDLSDGVSGELYSEDGWISKYSQFKSYDD